VTIALHDRVATRQADITHRKPKKAEAAPDVAPGTEKKLFDEVTTPAFFHASASAPVADAWINHVSRAYGGFVFDEIARPGRVSDAATDVALANDTDANCTSMIARKGSEAPGVAAKSPGPSSAASILASLAVEQDAGLAEIHQRAADSHGRSDAPQPASSDLPLVEGDVSDIDTAGRPVTELIHKSNSAAFAAPLHHRNAPQRTADPAPAPANVRHKPSDLAVNHGVAISAESTSLTYSFAKWNGQPVVSANLQRRELTTWSSALKSGLRESLGSAPGVWRVGRPADGEGGADGAWDDMA
jgi:hypothetical protein